MIKTTDKMYTLEKKEINEDYIIKTKLDDIEFPAQLTLKEQGKFILGYYHQKQKKYEKREEK